jgi:hypothetical protein
MSDRNWEKELAKIDKQLESVSDEALFPTKDAKTPAAKEAAVAKQRSTSTLAVAARLLLGVALGVGMLFWPYETRCGIGLAGYLAAVGVLVTAGVWSALWTWRHRTAKAHLLSLLLVLWGGVLGATEILPRIGYAKPDPARTGWVCP